MRLMNTKKLIDIKSFMYKENLKQGKIFYGVNRNV